MIEYKPYWYEGITFNGFFTEIKRMIKEVYYSFYRRIHMKQFMKMMTEFLTMDSRTYNYTVKAIKIQQVSSPNDYICETNIEVFIENTEYFKETKVSLDDRLIDYISHITAKRKNEDIWKKINRFGYWSFTRYSENNK